ncbi:potassium voltage-gated channel protein Shaw-like [Haliotis cracherodii]|uniref:potassium voltage-gated channel protein Shaw-like n=1 Tax=Haliotis cracherodii TaxID=6455 RepID=UPI0039E7545E
MATVTLNVSGKKFTIGKTILERFPDTMLGRLTIESPHYDPSSDEFFFDRNPKMVLPMLDLYRTGELHLPSNLCTFTIKNELRFWELKEDLISECCWKKYVAAVEDMKAVDIIEKSLYDHLSEKPSTLNAKHKIWMTLEYPSCTVMSKLWFSLYMIMVTVAVVTACLSMSPEMRIPMEHLDPNWNSSSVLDMLLNTEMNTEIYVIDLICLLFFTFELLVRFLLSPSKRSFFKCLLNAMDILLTFVMWCSVILDHVPAIEHAQVGHTVLRALFCLNILRVFHLGKTSKGVKLLLFTLSASMEAFGLLLVSMTMAVVIYATLVYFAEFATNSDAFENIPIAVWWAVVTMTTVGYGDYYPKSWTGYIVGIMCALSGILLLALPIAIIASNFNTFYSNLSSAEQRLRRKRLQHSEGRTDDKEKYLDGQHK